ncbi:MAG: CARDB domain-containing protein [Candidatus Moraniibacteriota bacterium]
MKKLFIPSLVVMLFGGLFLQGGTVDAIDLTTPGQAGLNVGGGIASPARLDAMQAMGAKWVRFDLPWADVMSGGSNSYNWAAFDTEIANIISRGMEPLPIIDFTPAWARPSNCTGSDKCGPANASDYGHFAGVVAARYPQIHVFEIWNEENISTFWQPQPNFVAYTAILKAGYTAIKAANPAAQVITGGTAPAISNGTDIGPADFLTGIYNNGGGGYFDGVSVHPYCYGNAACPNFSANWSGWNTQMLDVRNVMVAHGDSAKKIWGTEFGAPTSGNGDNVTEAQQATMVTNGYNLFRSYSWAGPVFIWHKDQDLCTTSSDTECFFGLIRYAGTYKPGRDAFIAISNTGAPTLSDMIATAVSYNPATGTFQSTIKNQGTVATPSGTIIGVGYLVDGVSRTYSDTTIGPLVAGASITVGTNGPTYFIPNGTHTITAWVDDINRFPESDETNNQFSQTITVGDTTPPTLVQVTPVPSVSRNHTPSYTFSSTEAGTISYTGDCSSSTTAATSGNNTITLNTLARGTHSNCSLIVTDAANNPSASLSLNSFIISYASDLNQDRSVNVLDFGLLHNNYGTSNAAGDVNYDGMVDVLDFGVLHTEYGGSV